MDAMEAILTRRSIRRYTDEDVSAEQVETLLRAAMAAPSAIDNRDWAFVVVRDRQMVADIRIRRGRKRGNAENRAGGHCRLRRHEPDHPERSRLLDSGLFRLRAEYSARRARDRARRGMARDLSRHGPRPGRGGGAQACPRILCRWPWCCGSGTRRAGCRRQTGLSRRRSTLRNGKKRRAFALLFFMDTAVSPADGRAGAPRAPRSRDGRAARTYCACNPPRPAGRTG